MEFINATRMVPGYNMGLEPSGRELLVVVIKGTFVLPRAGEPVRLHEQQLPLIMSDTFTGEPGFSAPVYEIDFAPRKTACDVLLVGQARAPEGRQVSRLRASMRVGPMEKVFDVVGDRVWQAGLTGISASAPLPFTEMPVSYDRAYGGADRHSEDPGEHYAYLPNPVGRGWHKHLKNAWVDGQPLPNTEELGKAVSFPPGFINHPGVEPTNNAAEQALRGIVLKRKISGPTRSRRGDEFIARGFSVHETCRRQGMEMWGYLHKAVVAWIDKVAHPSLVPAAVPSG